MRKDVWSDDQIIQAVKMGGEKRQSALAYIYQNVVLRERVFNFVRHKGGSQKEAEELFIEAVIVIDRNLRADKFKGDSSITTYSYGIAKFLWLNHSRKKKTSIATLSLDENQVEVSDVKCPELIFIQSELKEKLARLIDLLNDKCKLILKLWSEDAKYDEIAAELGIEKSGSLRKQKLVCLRKLKEHLIQNPELIPSQFYGRVTK